MNVENKKYLKYKKLNIDWSKIVACPQKACGLVSTPLVIDGVGYCRNCGHIFYEDKQ